MDAFKLEFFTRRWNTDVTLDVKKTKKGWHISHMAINGETDPEGSPILIRNLDQDNVQYPEGVGGFLGFIWGQLHQEEIDSDLAQEMFDELGNWISTCESSQPVWKTWNA
jgi:hypothetical protein